MWAQLTYLAYHLHWDLDSLRDMEHADRTAVIGEVAAMNERAWEGVRSIG